MDYKSTLNLPQTEFPMKANLPQREPDFIKYWQNDQIYSQLIQKNQGRPKFILHDGPPYANGHIHFGHILNKILKDIIVKYKNMLGFSSPYVPGWDCHGLPIELGAVSELKAKEKDPEKIRDPLVRREACRQYALRFVEDQKEQFKRLGIFGDWEHSYLTLTNQYEADIAGEFLKLYLNGYVYQGKKPVYWCVSCRTALAEAEVEYENVISKSIYVPFKVINPKALNIPLAPGHDLSLVIWTTTPWTLPANLALAVGENFSYSAYSINSSVYIVATDLADSFFQALQITDKPQEMARFTGSDLAVLETEHPFIQRKSPVLLGEHVTLESGTGIVHIAPGHGQEDYEIGRSNGLDIYCPVDEAGRFLADSLEQARFPEVKNWELKSVKEANPLIVDFLHQKGLLLNPPLDQIPHSYPHCWRCKKPVIFRATEQWFCSLSHQDLKTKALRAINSEVRWIPSWGHDRIYGMIENRPDWCLSRQRIWGVPIIIHKCLSCHQPYLTEEAGKFIISQFEREGADIWWKTDKPLLPPGTQCPCGSQEFEKEGSILDVWFDSGVSYAAVLEKKPELAFPADLYLEGSDQHRGWFHSSLLTSLATRSHPPYKTVLTHGFVVDGSGRKYSKSAKNYIPPEKVIGEMGAELLRLWVAAEDYRNDIRVSPEIIKVLAEIYRKIRNTCRFMLGNLFDFNPSQDSIPFKDRTELDRYALNLMIQLVRKIEAAYENYEFHIVHHSLNKFFTVDLSALYLDILKDRLYCDHRQGQLRRSAQTTIYEILKTIMPLMSPILSFTAEEVFRLMPQDPSKPSSVFLSSWPKLSEMMEDKNLMVRWQRIGTIRNEVLKALEMVRQKKEIKHSLDAKVIFVASGETLDFLKQYASDWAQICIVSQTEIREESAGYLLESQVVSSLKIDIQQASGQKCERCWNYSEEVGTNPTHPGLCNRCSKVVSMLQ